MNNNIKSRGPEDQGNKGVNLAWLRSLNENKSIKIDMGFKVEIGK